MGDKLSVNVVTPERTFLNDDCESITVPARFGEMQLLPGHAPYLAELLAGLISYRKAGGEEVRFMIGPGFLEIDQNRINILCEEARFKDEIDAEEESRLLANLGDRLQEGASKDADQKKLVADMLICTAKLRLFE